MPVEFTVEEPSLFFMRAFGVVTVEEVRLAIGRMLADPRLRAGAGILIDNREATSNRSVSEVAVITAAFAKLFARGALKVAIVTGGELEASRVFASFASTVGADAKVFRAEQQARNWLKSGSQNG